MEPIPVTKRSGWPGGHRAETLQPWRTNAIARRAEEGHHRVAQIKIFGWEFPSKKPLLGCRTALAIPIYSTYIVENRTPTMHKSWYCLLVGKSINYLIRYTSGQGMSCECRYCDHRSRSLWPLHRR